MGILFGYNGFMGTQEPYSTNQKEGALMDRLPSLPATLLVFVVPVHIVPQHAIDWQVEAAARAEKFDSIYPKLQAREASIRQALQEPRELEEHDRLYAELDEIAQEMIDLQQQMEDSYGGEYD